MKEVRIILPRRVYEALEKLEREKQITKEDLILRAIVNLLKEYNLL